MRLLKQVDSAFRLVEFTGSNIPPYAILSHTWGSDEEEVTFHDVLNDVGKNKTGYRKLAFCGEQAAKDGLQFFWVDTCCIDKSSSAELTESINSMFQWYHKAAQCYVYLSDLSLGGTATDEQSFQNSKWFTRGWTLQELLAPTSVQFFTAEGKWFGSRDSLQQTIYNATGISQRALQGESLHQFSIETRLSWAERRETKREEDAAYSLLGIFGVYMPLIYGEGRRNALARLQKEINESLVYQRPYASPTRSAYAAATHEPGNLPYKHPLPFNDIRDLLQEQQRLDASQKILNSLRYPRSEERRLQVHEAQIGTYQWILEPKSNRKLQSDSLLDWLSSSTESWGIYWIYGKPGSGKSTMMRFLDRNIITPDHMLPWTTNKTVLKAQYFFWGPGSELQKSIVGLLRSLLFQLLTQNPRLIPEVVDAERWAAARTPGARLIDWTQLELQHTLYRCILSVQEFATVFFLLDGLDELSGTDDTRDELLRFLIKVTGFQHVKICLSSRPWNIFRDAFEGCPKLRLEDSTRDDISLYVKAQLSSQMRFRHLLLHHQGSAESLMNKISEKASGVFLWVHLVLRELLAGLRDGDGMHMLQKRLDLIPADLNDYFKRLIDSIEPRQRYEASVLLQIALYVENDFDTLHPLRLIDLSFTDEGRPDFILSSQYRLTDVSLTDPEVLEFHLDSTIRRLNSRCMGLLECHYEHVAESFDGNVEPITSLITSLDWLAFDDNGINTVHSRKQPDDCPDTQAHVLRQVHNLTIDFFHRTCRDFLLTPEVQGLLLEYSKGRYDAQMYLVNARICQFLELATVEDCALQAMSLASNILSSLARPAYRTTSESAKLAAVIKTRFEILAQNYNSGESGSYISPSVESWNEENSSFLTLAIDFDISSYVQQHLTPEYVLNKRGRPILDYILRPRFPDMFGKISIGNQRPNMELLRTVLQLGVNPNEMYGSGSIWALFLCFLADLFPNHRHRRRQIPDHVAAIEEMIRAGAALTLPKSWLSRNADYAFYTYSTWFQRMDPEHHFLKRWPAAVPVVEQNGDPESEPLYAVSDLLEHFRPRLGSVVDSLKGVIDSVDKSHT